MTYGDIYEVLKYLKEHHLDYSYQLKKVIMNSEISKEEYELLLYGSGTFELYFGIEPSKREAVRHFLLSEEFVYQFIPIEEIKECITLILSQDTLEKQEEVASACLVREIRQDKKFLRLLCNQETKEEQRNLINKYLQDLRMKETQESISEINKLLEICDLDNFFDYYSSLDKNVQADVKLKEYKIAEE